VVFLSYAEEDAQAGNHIAALLRAQGLTAYNWRDSAERGGRFIEKMETEIRQADAFLALLSPDFLASSWCRMEREFALRIEMDRRERGGAQNFVHVSRVADTPSLAAGFLGNYDWIDLTDPDNRDDGIRQLAERLRPDERRRGPANAPVPSRSGPFFRNRQAELDEVSHGLLNPAGPHFWIVSAPPALGKTWFLDRLNATVIAAEPENWVTRLVDLRELSPDARGDARAILAALFRLEPPGRSPSEEMLRGVARDISRSGRSHLCLVDSAELMTDEAARALRSWLARIYGLMQDAGRIKVRVAVVVASRRDDKWRGVTPRPRFSSLPLTEFSENVVQEALRDLAQEMGDRAFGNPEFRANAARVHRLSEGLPALLAACLHWIRHSQWIGMDRLDGQDLFEELAASYVDDGLLAGESLFPWRDERSDEALQALDRALRSLVSYRLFTRSHLRHHLDADPEFGRLLVARGWSVEDLWEAVSQMALLKQPLNEVWQELHKPIRRLLYRYYYTSDQERAVAHGEARVFVEEWAGRQSGKDRAVGLVECLWHEAEMMRLDPGARSPEQLCDFAWKVGQAFRASVDYDPSELRGFAADRIMEDEELQESVSHINGLGDRLGNIVRNR
jgi:hypothetical protein